MRPGRFPRIATPYDNICDDVLIDIWHSTSGIELDGNGKVSAWRSIKRGVALSQSNSAKRPVYAADGAHFKGRPVVQFAKASADVLENLAISPSLGLNTDAVSLWAIARLRTVPADNAGFFATLWLAARNVAGNGTNTLAYRLNSSAGGGYWVDTGWAAYIGFRDNNYNYYAQWWTPAYLPERALLPTLTMSSFAHQDNGDLFFYGVALNDTTSGGGIAGLNGRGTGGYDWMRVGSVQWWNTTDDLDISVAAIVVLRHAMVTDVGWPIPQPSAAFHAVRAQLCADFGI